VIKVNRTEGQKRDQEKDQKDQGKDQEKEVEEMECPGVVVE